MQKPVLTLILAWLAIAPAVADEPPQVIFGLYSLASTNTFTESDANALLHLYRNAIALATEVNESSGIANQMHGDERVILCLSNLGLSLDSITSELSAASDLIRLSAEMKDSTDELIVNAMIATNSSLTLKTLANAEKFSVHQAAWCQSSVLVNNYAQQIAALADKVTAMIKASTNAWNDLGLTSVPNVLYRLFCNAECFQCGFAAYDLYISTSLQTVPEFLPPGARPGGYRRPRVPSTVARQISNGRIA